ncbi:MAG: putative ABC transporter permease [Velocimicrobium sp.]
MWSKELFGTDVYHLIACFIVYSMLGWLLESLYMSVCNHKITNRGFMLSPFCPIYGFGAVTGYLLLHPFAGNVVKLYLIGAISATIFEFLVGKLMIRLFGELWWDYNEKPLNYKGIICVESTIAWGFYAVAIILYLNSLVIKFINRQDMSMGIMLCRVILVVFIIDFSYHLMHALGVNISKYREKMHEKYESIKARLY